MRFDYTPGYPSLQEVVVGKFLLELKTSVQLLISFKSKRTKQEISSHFHFPFVLLLLLMAYVNFGYHMVFITIYVVYIKSSKFHKNQIKITLAF